VQLRGETAQPYPKAWFLKLPGAWLDGTLDHGHLADAFSDDHARRDSTVIADKVRKILNLPPTID